MTILVLPRRAMWVIMVKSALLQECTLHTRHAHLGRIRLPMKCSLIISMNLVFNAPIFVVPFSIFAYLFSSILDIYPDYHLFSTILVISPCRVFGTILDLSG